MRAKTESNHGCCPSGGVSKTLERDLMSQQREVVAFFDAEAPKPTQALGRTNQVVPDSFPF
jgi:hypothetical protein